MALRLISLIVVLILAGCATPPRTPEPRFIPLTNDPRVQHEPGADNAADRVAKLLPNAIGQVEAAHYRPFTRAVTVFVCGTEECFKREVRRTKVSAALVPDNRIILAPQLFEREAHRLSDVLTHELSHLHLGQQTGHYTPNIPVWFHEGLAAHASNGGGAEYATDEDAIEALRQGKHFEPAKRDSPLHRHLAEHWGLNVFTFYRQAMLFVRYLRDQSEWQFQHFMQSVQDRMDFDLAFTQAYNMTLSEAGERFVNHYLSTPAAPSQPVD